MILLKFLVPIIATCTAFSAPINTIYEQRCANCHGMQGDKPILTKAKAIRGLPAADIEKALNDYATGKRGALPAVKSMKKYFIEHNSKEQIHELAEYINKM